MVKVYHNPQCSKSRGVLKLLTAYEGQLLVQEYLTEKMTEEELRNVLGLLGMKPLALIRQSESVFKEKYSSMDYNDDQWIAIMLEHPILIERPIIISKGRAVIGRPIEKVVELLAP